MVTFLYFPGLVDATNNLVERLKRMLVVVRKNSGGTREGSEAQPILTSVLCTAPQQDVAVFEIVDRFCRDRRNGTCSTSMSVEVAAIGASTPPELTAVGDSSGGECQARGDVSLLPRTVRRKPVLLGAESGSGTRIVYVGRRQGWRRQGRDAWIGLTDGQRKRNLQGIVNNGRFLILPWVAVKGLASESWP